MGARQQQLLGEVIDALCASQRLMELYENQGRRSGDIVQGDSVYLSTANLGNSHFKQKCRKLRERYQGPYRVIKKVADHIFRLQLPENDFPRIHPEFHQSLLWKTLPQEVRKEEKGEQLDEGVPDIGQVEADVYLVEEIMDFKKGKGYLVRWTGYPDESDWTWQRGSDFLGEDAKKMVKDFRNINKVTDYHREWVLTSKDTPSSSLKTGKSKGEGKPEELVAKGQKGARGKVKL